MFAVDSSLAAAQRVADDDVDGPLDAAADDGDYGGDDYGAAVGLAAGADVGAEADANEAAAGNDRAEVDIASLHDGTDPDAGAPAAEYDDDDAVVLALVPVLAPVLVAV